MLSTLSLPIASEHVLPTLFANWVQQSDRLYTAIVGKTVADVFFHSATHWTPAEWQYRVSRTDRDTTDLLGGGFPDAKSAMQAAEKLILRKTISVLDISYSSKLHAA